MHITDVRTGPGGLRRSRTDLMAVKYRKTQSYKFKRGVKIEFYTGRHAFYKVRIVQCVQESSPSWPHTADRERIPFLFGIFTAPIHCVWRVGGTRRCLRRGVQ